MLMLYVMLIYTTELENMIEIYREIMAFDTS